MACTRVCLHTTFAQDLTLYMPHPLQSYINLFMVHQCWPNWVLLLQILTFVFWEQYKKLASNL